MPAGTLVKVSPTHPWSTQHGLVGPWSHWTVCVHCPCHVQCPGRPWRGHDTNVLGKLRSVIASAAAAAAEAMKRLAFVKFVTIVVFVDHESVRRLRHVSAVLAIESTQQNLCELSVAIKCAWSQLPMLDVNCRWSAPIKQWMSHGINPTRAIITALWTAFGSYFTVLFIRKIMRMNRHSSIMQFVVTFFSSSKQN